MRKIILLLCLIFFTTSFASEWYEKNKKVLFTAHNILTTQHKISKIKSSGKNLKKYQKLKLFKTIADKIHYGIMVTNLTGRIKYVNPYYANVHGYRQKELLGEKMSVFHTNKQIKDYKEKYHICSKRDCRT